MSQTERLPGELVSCVWLAEHLDDPKVRVIEVSASPDKTSYLAGHIPGSMWWFFHMRLLSTDTERIFSGDRINKLEDNSLRVVGGSCRLEAKMETSEGTIELNGRSDSVPVAREVLKLRRRLLRTL